MKDVSISYPSHHKIILSDINFPIQNKDHIILDVKNDCGKSNILKAISVENKHFTDSIQLASGLIISYVS